MGREAGWSGAGSLGLKCCFARELGRGRLLAAAEPRGERGKIGGRLLGREGEKEKELEPKRRFPIC